jgi:hypothetical protein
MYTRTCVVQILTSLCGTEHFQIEIMDEGVLNCQTHPSSKDLRFISRHPLKLNLKLSHYTPRRSLEETSYSSYSFSTLAIDGGEWSASRPSRALAPGKGPPVSSVQEAGWAPEPVSTQRLQEKSYRLCRGSNPDRPVVQTVARYYTD